MHVDTCYTLSALLTTVPEDEPSGSKHVHVLHIVKNQIKN
jgi:hypothetical protein